jgi:hypothetical protein
MLTPFLCRSLSAVSDLTIKIEDAGLIKLKQPLKLVRYRRYLPKPKVFIGQDPLSNAETSWVSPSYTVLVGPTWVELQVIGLSDEKQPAAWWLGETFASTRRAQQYRLHLFSFKIYYRNYSLLASHIQVWCDGIPQEPRSFHSSNKLRFRSEQWTRSNPSDGLGGSSNLHPPGSIKSRQNSSL